MLVEHVQRQLAVVFGLVADELEHEVADAEDYDAEGAQHEHDEKGELAVGQRRVAGHVGRDRELGRRVSEAGYVSHCDQVRLWHRHELSLLFHEMVVSIVIDEINVFVKSHVDNSF